MFPPGPCCQPVTWPEGDRRATKCSLREEGGVPGVTLLKGVWRLQLLLLLPLTLLLPFLPPSLLFSGCQEVNSSALGPGLCCAAPPSQNATGPGYYQSVSHHQLYFLKLIVTGILSYESWLTQFQKWLMAFQGKNVMPNSPLSSDTYIIFLSRKINMDSYCN
jgi:hypothetical protein